MDPPKAHDRMDQTDQSESLDPSDWPTLRAQGHAMLDDMFDHLQGLRSQPVWRAPPQALRESFRAALPWQGQDLGEVHERFVRDIAPYSSGNAHPGFMGWVQGGGTPVGMLAEMLAAGLNSNLGGRDHMPLQVERQVAGWMRDLFGFPAGANGLFLTGASQANFCAVLMARRRALGVAVRREGVAQASRLVAYTSRAAHGCISRAMNMAGLGSDSLRLIDTDDHHRMNIDRLTQAVDADLRAGLKPFLVVGTAGTVDIGAVDDLQAIAGLAAANDMAFHVDGAFGALAILAPALAPRLAGIERADTIAFDFHKWGQVPYDAGFLLARDSELQRQTFATGDEYLRRADRGLAGGAWWPCDYGPDLSRGFRALKTWFTLQTYGLERIGACIQHSCDLAARLGARIAQSTELRLLAPVQLNIVCFGHAGPDAERINPQIVMDLHEAGRVAPSLTKIGDHLAIRAAIINHRTAAEDVDALADAAEALSRAYRAESRDEAA